VTTPRLIAWLALGFVLATSQLRPASAADTQEVALKRVNLLDSSTETRAAGLRVVEPRRSKTPEGREFSELGFTDPDGHVVVLYQLD
jgi:hypothetical protein